MPKTNKAKKKVAKTKTKVVNKTKAKVKNKHKINEIIKISSPSKGGVFVDCTFGGGSYSKCLLKYPKINLIGIDRDNAVIPEAKKLEKKFDNRFKFYHIKFSQINLILKECVDTIIFDLGLSSIQLNNFKRGFSFNSKESLDMKMGLSEISAQEAINNLSETELKTIIKFLGEEKALNNFTL